MEEFESNYESFIKIPKNIIENKEILYKKGFDIISKTDKLETKELILSKLMTLYPNDTVLYYKMANIFKPFAIERAILWHKITHQLHLSNKEKKQDFIDNFIELFKILFERGNYEHMQYLNQDNLFDYFMNNTKFVYMYVRSRFSLCLYENSIKYMQFLIQSTSQKKANTFDEKMEKYNNYNDIGYMYSHTGDVENAIKYMKKAIELSNKFNLPLSNRLLSFQTSLYLHDFIYKENNIYQSFLEMNTFFPDKPLFTVYNNRTLHRIPKIGYLSSDFNPHSVANFILPILKHHDRTKFDIYLFSNDENVSKLFLDLQLPIYKINGLNSIESAKIIHNLQIDILFDLNGHTANNRLDVFAHRPAPIQISYLGYANTTGLTSIQYRLTDFVADHPDSTQFFSEQLIRMPGCFLLFDPIHNFTVQPKKTVANRVVLASLHKEAKLNEHVFSVWKKILDACPNAVLFIKLESFDNVKERTEYYTKKINVDKERIIISPNLYDKDYDSVYTKFDILLDSFPYSGTTITCNTLYNSIPVITLYNNDIHAHNVSSSLLINSGLSEFVAYSQNEYVDIVVDLVKIPEKIDYYKGIIRNKFMSLMDAKSFMNKYEDVLTKIYNDDIESFIVKKKEIEPLIVSESLSSESLSSDNITIDFSKNEGQTRNVYICGSLRNCGHFIDGVFINIDKIIKLFDNYKIIISYDNINDNSLDILQKKKAKYNMELIHVLENEDILHRDMRTQRISNARNEILKYIRKDTPTDDYKYLIVMDMDDCCAGIMNIDALAHYISNDSEWDALSFNNRPEYYDVWALSIKPYILSCWHFPNGDDVVCKISDYMTKRLNGMKKYELLECESAFNGFAIYKKSKFIDCNYNWRIKNIVNFVSDEQRELNEKVIGKPFTMNKSYQQHIHPATDCEHRQFHMEAIRKHNAKIRISPIYLFS